MEACCSLQLRGKKQFLEEGPLGLWQHLQGHELPVAEIHIDHILNNGTGKQAHSLGLVPVLCLEVPREAGAPGADGPCGRPACRPSVTLGPQDSEGLAPGALADGGLQGMLPVPAGCWTAPVWAWGWSGSTWVAAGLPHMPPVCVSWGCGDKVPQWGLQTADSHSVIVWRPQVQDQV